MPSIDICFVFGKKIAYLRKKRKMTLLELSLITGLSQSYISDIEHGRRNPSLKTIRNLAQALEVDLVFLFEGIRDYALKSEEVKIPSIK